MGWIYAVPRSGSVGLAGGGLHLFMDQGCWHNMTAPTFVENFLKGSPQCIKAGACARFVLPKGVWTVSTLISALLSSSCAVGVEESRIASGMQP